MDSRHSLNTTRNIRAFGTLLRPFRRLCNRKDTTQNRGTGLGSRLYGHCCAKSVHANINMSQRQRKKWNSEKGFLERFPRIVSLVCLFIPESQDELVDAVEVRPSTFAGLRRHIRDDE